MNETREESSSSPPCFAASRSAHLKINLGFFFSPQHSDLYIRELRNNRFTYSFKQTFISQAVNLLKFSQRQILDVSINIKMIFGFGFPLKLG